jgi:hypothetical protein
VASLADADLKRQLGRAQGLGRLAAGQRRLLALRLQLAGLLVSSLHGRWPDLTLTVVLPEIVVRHWWHRLLHNRTTPRLRRALRPLAKIVVTTVPFHLPA